MQVTSLKTLLLVLNPKAGSGKLPDKLFEVVNMLTAAGFLVTVFPSQGAGEIGKVITSIGSDYDYLVCSGGDGTTADAIDALISLNKRPAFGIIPSGTVNDFASSLGLPKDITAAAELIISSFPRSLDIGRFENKHFSYVAAFGLFTDVSYATPQESKNLFGKLAYFMESVKRLGTIESYECSFETDQGLFAGDFILGIITNATSVAGFKLPDEMDIRIDDGYFDVILIKKPASLMDWQGIITALVKMDLKNELFTVFKTQKLKFTSSEPIAWTLDGDFGGKFIEAEIMNLHNALEIITV